MVERLGTVGIVGVGLIGASLGLALRERGLVDRVVGVDVDAGAVVTAKKRGAIDEGGSSDGLLGDADLVAVAVPPQAVVDAALGAARVMKSGAILTDLASTKAEIVRRLEETLPPGVRYVGSHPMAGSEHRGAQAAEAALLVGRPFLVTPTARTDPAAVAFLTDLAEALGMRPVLLKPDDHDELVAQISHLPYLLAVAAVSAVTDQARGVRGRAFSDLARVASSPPELWTQICRMNRAAIKRAIARFRQELDRLERALDEGASLQTLLEQSQRRAKGNH